MEGVKKEIRTALIIEDNIDVLQLIGRILSQEGYRVLMAQDSIYGMALLKESNPDVVLLDIRMPEPDGFKTLQMIRHDSKVPVMMVSANWEQEAVEKATLLGANDYVKKPFSPMELTARVNMLIRSHDSTE
jgi:DNA-binding response OmpR family regulator